METTEPTPAIRMLDLDALGTIDEALARADELATHYKAVAANVGRRHGPFGLTLLSMAWLSLLARLQGLHDGIAREIRAENPHAAYPLLRSFVETVAMLIYLADHPEYVEVLQRPHDEVKRVTARALVNHATPRMPGIDPIYSQLCQVAHFDTIALNLPWEAGEDECARTLSWQSKPKWKRDGDALVACGWLIELAEASHLLLTEYADRHLTAASSGP